MNDEVKFNVRMNVALKFGDSKTIAELKEIADFVIGPVSSILPVSNFKVVEKK